ncbi:MAG: hypothetical protein PHF00_05000 [Elusimicrobia bacterium]|nr:hypothetical protein [Elusimicrobiota bacterium]
MRNQALHDELVSMSKADQEVRQALIASGIEHPSPEITSRMEMIDATNTARMREIIHERGWPGKTLVGHDGDTAAFLLVQHADRDHSFQKEVLPLLAQAYKSGETSGEHLALLTDRILVGEGKKQRYGSQAKIAEGQIMVDPVEDESNLDKRRAELGLPPMHEYIELMRKAYGLAPQSK